MQWRNYKNISNNSLNPVIKFAPIVIIVYQLNRLEVQTVITCLLSLFFLHLGVLILQKEVAKTMYQKVEGKATKNHFYYFCNGWVISLSLCLTHSSEFFFFLNWIQDVYCINISCVCRLWLRNCKILLM